MITGLSAGTAGVLTAPAAQAATGTAAGRVFRDYNLNGVFDTTTSAASPAVDVGISGVVVTAYDKDNNSVATATTGATGAYSLAYTTTTSSSKVRLEFATPAGLVPSRAGITGSTNDSDVQFVSSGVTTADYALTYPQDYSPGNPTFSFARQVGALKFDGSAQSATAGTLFSNPYNTRGTTTTTPATKEATVTQTGSVWGVATLGSDYIFSSAMLKRHAAVGPGGLGAVYVTVAGGATDASSFATVANAGTNPRAAGITTAQYFNDPDAFASIGKVGLGGMVMAPDDSALYVVNLNTKALVRIPVATDAAGVPSAGTQTTVAIPTPSSCTAANLRPWGVSSANRALWVTQTCVGPAVADQKGYVFKYDLTTNTFAATPAFQFALNYPRGFAYSGGNQPATWEIWQDATTGTSIFPKKGTSVSNPQPLLSDVSFDANGNMSIGIKDRFGDQAGYAGRPIAGDNEVYEAMAAGDTLRACGGPTTWTLESNGSCGSRTGVGVGNGDGPGNGEFYADDFNTDSHDQVSLGGMLQVPGFPHLINTTFDPKPTGGDSEYGTNGYRFWSHTNGSVDAANGWRQVGTAVRAAGEESTYGKAGGMGDLDLLVRTPVEIGNRVWIDTDRDGIQDAEEPGVSGVQVRLFDSAGTTLLSSTTTDTSGEYYFNDANYSGISARTAYVVKIDRASDYTSGGALSGYTTTGVDVGSKDTIDSDATTVGGFGQIVVRTPKFGADHSFDAGFYKKAVSVGDFVFVDTDRDGIQDAGEPGLPGVTVTIVGPMGAAVTDINGATVGPVVTGANGQYAFSNLPALAAGQTYTVKVDNTQAALAAYVPTITGAGTLATDSSNGSAVSSTALTADGASDLTLDFGFVKKAVSVGDLVFVDSNRDGIQTAGEPGLAGVRVTLVGPSGTAVTNVNGATVGPVVTGVGGGYTFANLPVLTAGQSYTVRVDNTQAALSDYVPTLTGAGTPATDSSNGSAASGNLTTNGASDTTLDFGFFRKSVTVGDYVWLDTDRDGIQSAGENGIGGVTLTLVGPTGNPVTNTNGAVVGAATTSAAGAYTFTNLPVLPAGSHYTVRIDNTQAALSAYVPTLTGQGTAATDSSNGAAESGNLLTNGASDLTLDFGFVKPAVSVGDLVFVDSNGNGVQNAGEPGLSGVTVTIVGPGGNAVTNVNGGTVGPVVTDASGAYSFTLLPALPVGQRYTVRVDNTQPALAGYVPTITGQGTAATDSSNGSAVSGNLATNGASDTTLDFGFVSQNASIELDKTASSINDLDGNGPDAGDTIGYSFKVTNTGGATLTAITVSDPMFSAITCPPGALAGGASVTCSQQTHTLTAADVSAGTVDNTATATGTKPGGGTVSDTDSTHTPVVPADGLANIKVSKTADNASPHVGDTVTYTVTVSNTGTAPAADVVLKDLLPAGVTFVSASTPCAQSAGTVACSFGTIPAGAVKTVTIRATVDNTPAGTTQERHGIDVQKAEAVLDLEAGQTGSTTVACQPGYVVLDGSARIVHVDGGTGTLGDVAILENRASAMDTWKVTLKNNATGRAQDKVFALCAKQETETVNGHSHKLQVAAAQVSRTVALPAGRTDVTLSCASGETPVQPGWLLDGAARVPTSYPSGASSWVFGVQNAATGGATSGSFAIRCLKNKTGVSAGHSHDLLLGELFRTVTVPAGKDMDVVLDCADSPLGDQGAKGIVAGLDLDAGLLHLGNEPQPIRRVFTLSNPTDKDLKADLYLVCLGTRTAGHDGSGTIVNTASATTSSPETTTNDNASSATITVTAAPVTQSPKANLRVAKSVSSTTPRVGDTVTYTLKVTNDSDNPATDVVLTDPLPTGVTFVGASAPCSLSGSTVTCALGTVAAGATRTVTITATVDAAPAAGTAHTHDVDVQKSEAQINLAAGETRTVTVDCGSGYLATDGSGRIDQIDQGTGTPDAVRIAGSHAVDDDTWSVTLANGATGNAQGKAFVVCAKKSTSETDGHSHALVLGSPVTRTVALPAGQSDVALSCGPGTTPIQPGFQLTGSATVRTSYPALGGWRFVVDNAGAAAGGDFSIRCLDTQVSTSNGHQHDLSLTPMKQTAVVGPGQTVEVTSSCAGDAKGIVAGYAMDKGLVQLGNDPRPIVRVFRFYNPTGSDRSVDLSLLCLGNRTSSNPGSGSVTNTAYASTSTPETTTGDNTASASFKVDTSAVATPTSTVATVSRSAVVSTAVTCGPGTSSCRGTASLKAVRTQTIAGRTLRKGTVLATTTFKITAGRVVTVKMAPTATGRKVLTSSSLRTAQVKVGPRTRTVTIRR